MAAAPLTSHMASLRLDEGLLIDEDHVLKFFPDSFSSTEDPLRYRNMFEQPSVTEEIVQVAKHLLDQTSERKVILEQKLKDPSLKTKATVMCHPSDTGALSISLYAFIGTVRIQQCGAEFFDKIEMIASTDPLASLDSRIFLKQPIKRVSVDEGSQTRMTDFKVRPRLPR